MSQMDPTTETINGNEYIMYPLAPDKSADLLIDVIAIISPIVGPALVRIFFGKAKPEDKELLGKELSADMFEDVFTKLDAAELKGLRNKLTSAFGPVTHRNGIQLDKVWQKEFRGNLTEMFKWLGWGCMAQWGKSWSALGIDLPFLNAQIPDQK